LGGGDRCSKGGSTLNPERKSKRKTGKRVSSFKKQNAGGENTKRLKEGHQTAADGGRCALNKKKGGKKRRDLGNRAKRRVKACDKEEKNPPDGCEKGCARKPQRTWRRMEKRTYN